MSEHLDPAAEYRTRLAERQARVADAEGRAGRIANARLAVFLLGVAAVYLAVGPRTVPGWLTLVPAVLFVALVVVHDRLLRQLARAPRRHVL